jgi:hypothetical protein
MFLLLMAIGFIGNLIISYLPESDVTSFFNGFFTGLGTSAAVLSLIVLPIMRGNFKKIKNHIRELYVIEGV